MDRETKIMLRELHDELVFIRGQVPASSTIIEKRCYYNGLRSAFTISIDEVKKRIDGTNFNPNQAAYQSEKGNAKFAGDMKIQIPEQIYDPGLKSGFNNMRPETFDFFDPVP